MRRSIYLLGLACVFLLVCSCKPAKKPADPSGTNNENAEEERVVIPVEAQKPERGAISEYVRTDSRVEAENRVEVTSEAVSYTHLRAHET